MIFEMNLETIPFEATKAGRKTIEVRLGEEKRLAIKVGDTIRFKELKTLETIQVEVIGIRGYPSIELLAQTEPLSNTGGIYLSRTDWIDNIRRYYPPDKISSNGLLVFEIKIMSMTP